MRASTIALALATLTASASFGSAAFASACGSFASSKRSPSISAAAVASRTGARSVAANARSSRTIERKVASSVETVQATADATDLGLRDAEALSAGFPSPSADIGHASVPATLTEPAAVIPTATDCKRFIPSVSLTISVPCSETSGS